MNRIFIVLYIATLFSCSGEAIDNNSIQTPAKIEKKTIKKESSMFGLFGKKELKNYYISSPLQGLLVKDGKPMANTKIIRHLVWNGNEDGIRDEVFTDENGNFDIPGHQEELALSAMTEFVGSISLFAESESEDNCFWYSSKREAHIYSDIEKPLEELIFDLNKDEMSADVGWSSVLFRGTWKNMPEAY